MIAQLVVSKVTSGIEPVRVAAGIPCVFGNQDLLESSLFLPIGDRNDPTSDL